MPLLDLGITRRLYQGERSGDEPRQSDLANTCFGPRKTTECFLLEVQDFFLYPFRSDGILQISRGLKSQFRERLQTDPACMLPSYHHKLATGRERGRYVALDLGGSTFRVAIIELEGKEESREEPRSRIVEMRAFMVGKEVKDLVGTAFFDWLAARIIETIQGKRHALAIDQLDCLPLALTWSFPVEQTSPSSGRLQAMGKAFRAADGLAGQDLGSLVEAACLRAGLVAKIHILLNDSSATLISQTYTHPSTRFGLILGTGVNVAGYLPLPLIGSAKFGERPESWFAEARNVVINAELSMFGHGVLPQTRWDMALSQALARPDFQPLETMVSGMYLGEILRLVLVEAIETTGIFGGSVPSAFLRPYSLGTELLSMIEDNVFEKFQTAIDESSVCCGDDPYLLTEADRTFLRSLSATISHRSAAMVAASIHALSELRLEGLQEVVASSATEEERVATEAEASLEETTVAFTGSVIENYPGYLEKCQRLVEDLEADSSGGRKQTVGKIRFVRARESSLFGAGVALAAAMDDYSRGGTQ